MEIRGVVGPASAIRIDFHIEIQETQMKAQGGVQFNRFRSRQARMERFRGFSGSSHESHSEPSNGRETRLSEGSRTETSYRIARTRQDLLAACQLVYRIYLRHGFTQPISHGMRVTPYHALSSTDVFVAAQAGQVVCTMTLIKDDELGLPVESLYPDEVARYRDRGSVVAEVGCLAQRGTNFSVLLRLINLMAQRARFRGVDDLLIAVHPRHAKFYQRYLGFESIGPLRSYRAVCGQPAVALAVNLNRLYVRDQRACGHLFGVPFSLVDLMTSAMSAKTRAGGVCTSASRIRSVRTPCLCGEHLIP